MPKDTNVVETSNANKIFDIPVKLEPGQINTLSFDQDSISQMRELPGGELEIGFRDGSKVVVENFDELVNSAQSCGRDTLIQLSDNTIIYPDELAAQLAKGPVSFEGNIDAAGAVLLDQPKAGQIIEKNIQVGQEYKLGFDLDSTVSAAQAGQNLILTFKDGGVLVLKNYYTAMESDLPPAMTLADGSVIDSNALLTSCKLVEIPAVANSMAAANLAQGEVVQGVAVVEPAAGAEDPVEEAVASAARKGKAGKEGPPNVEPAAGDEPTDVANIEPAAGDAGNAPASSSRGYGFGSSIDGASLNGANPVGPIGATQLGYGANFPIGQLNPGERTFVDTKPVILSGGETVDETNLNPTTSVSGNANVNFGGNGIGSGGVTFNNGFVAGGSLDNGALTSHGNPVTVSAVGNTYTGTANGETIFTIVIDPKTGDYTFTQFKPLDHADATDPNDLITLKFGITATDADGDNTSGTITIGVCDDAPVAVDDGATVGDSPLTVTGNVVDNDDVGSDGSTVTQVVFNGTVYTVPAVGTVSIAATYGTLVIGANGAYTYTSHNTAEGTDKFTYTLTDYDGDVDTAVLSVEVTDIDSTPIIGNDEKTVDETNLGPNVVGGTLTHNFGDDTPGGLTLTNFSFNGSVKGGELASCGDKITVALVNGAYVGTDADGATIFTLTINSETGEYVFTQFKAIDHGNPNDPNDSLTLNFTVTGTDSDGDTSTGTIKINILDDGPVADDDHNVFDSNAGQTDGNVITGLNGGPGADDALSKDGGNKVTSVSFKGVEHDVPASGETTVNGDYGVLVIKADGSYTYTLYNGSTGGGSNTGNFSETNEFPTLNEGQPAPDAPKGVDPNALNITAGANGHVTIQSEGAGYSNTLGLYTIGADGSINAVQVISDNVNEMAIGASKDFGIPANGSGVGFFLIADGFTANNGYAGKDLSTGNLVFYYHYGQPDQRIAKVTDASGDMTLVYNNGGTEEVLSGPVYHTTDRGESTDINTDSQMHVVSGLADADDSSTLRIGFEDIRGLGDHDYNDVVFDFSYTPAPQIGTDEFVYTLTDCDGDSDKAVLQLTSEDRINDTPVLTAQVLTVDETTVAASGPQTVNGTVTVNFGADVPGAVAPSGIGTFAFSGSTNGNLTSNGVPVVVTLVGNQYVGKAGDTTIFTLSINSNGTYAFTQVGQLDHADKTNPDDTITLSFGVKATDGDGSVGTTNIVINVKDDGPVAGDDTNSVSNAPDSVTGNVLVNDNVGQDKPGYVVKQITFDGSTVDVPSVGTITVTGAHGTLTIGANGAYTYNGTSVGVDQFSYQIVDQDGDPATAKLTITVNDLNTVPVVDNTTHTIDETNLGPNVVTGTVPGNFGDDGPGTFTLTNFSATGSIKGDLASCGDKITVSLVNGSYVGIDADGATIFTLAINAATGAYTFTQFKAIDHGNPNDPNDSLTLNFTVTGTDSDGDADTGVISINILDDGPQANNDHNEFDSNAGTTDGNVLSGLNGGPGAGDVLSKDGGNKITSVSFKGVEHDVPASGETTVNGDYGTLVIKADGSYTYTLYNGSGSGTGAGTDGTFSESIKFPVTGDGSPSFDASSPNEGVNSTALDVTVAATGTVKIISETAGYSNSLGLYTIAADGTITAAQMIANDVNDLALGGTKNFDIPANGTGVGFFIVADGANVNNGYAGKDLSVGNLVFYYHYGQDDQRIAKVTDGSANITLVYVNGDTSEVISGPVYHTTDRDGSNGLNPDGEVHTISGLTTEGDTSSLRIGFEDFAGTGDGDYSDVVFDFTYTPAPATDTCDDFVYTVTDCDGDTDQAILQICSEDQINDTPVLTAEILTVDETIVAASGPQTVTGTVTVDYGADAAGTLTLAGPGSFTHTGATLTSHGIAVVVSVVGSQYIGKAGAETIFTLTVNPDGTYAYTQNGQLDHADKTNPDDIITLNFGVNATDGDGSVGSTSIKVNVHDDGPVAKDDTNSVGNAPGTVTGNIMTNDVIGEDKAGSLKSVIFGSTTVTVPTSGTVDIAGAHGTLTIDANGAYTYKGTSEGVDQFGYKIVDFDGDPATAKLTITVEGRDDVPTICNVDVCVDESNLGPISVTGNTTPNFFTDGPGMVHAAGASTFVAGGSLLNSKLTSGGVAVLVTLDAASNTYVGKAGDSTVFNIKINDNGTFKFTLFDTLDHANAKNPNDEITLKFGVVAKDADDDVALGTITVTVKDDAPCAVDDCYTIEACNCAKIGNVLLNDQLGHDGLGGVKSVSYNGKVYNLGEAGSTTINGENGKLTLNADGSFVYKPHNDACGTDSFKYTMTDFDKDSSSANLSFSTNDGGYGHHGGYSQNTVVNVTNNVTVDNHNDVSVSSYSHNDLLVVLENSSKMTINDFDPGEGDIIDLSSLVQNFDPVTDAINDFVFARSEGQDTVLSVDPAGKGVASQSYDVAVIKDVSNVHVEDIVSLTHQQQNQGGLGGA